MAREPSIFFLERDSYRRRRVMDAVRLIVVVGIGLWMVPVLWPSVNKPSADPVSMSDALFYVFGVWFFLIVVSAFLVSRLRIGRRRDSEDERQK